MLLFVQFFVGVICYLHCSLLSSLSCSFISTSSFFPFLPSSSFSFFHFPSFTILSTSFFLFLILSLFISHSAVLFPLFLYHPFLLTSSLPDLFSSLFTLSYFLLFSPPFTGSFTSLSPFSYSLILSVSFSLFFLPCTSLSLPYLFSFTDSFWQLFQFFSIYLVAIKITSQWLTTKERPYKQIPMNHIWFSSCVHLSHILTKISYFYINMLHSSSRYLLCLYRFLRYRHCLSYNSFITLLFR